MKFFIFLILKESLQNFEYLIFFLFQGCASISGTNKGVLGQNLFGPIFFLIAGAILAANCSKFNMGRVSY